MISLWKIIFKVLKQFIPLSKESSVQFILEMFFYLT